MGATDWGGRSRRAIFLLAAAAACAVAACKSVPPGGTSSSNQTNLGCRPSLLLFSGVKVVTETLAPNPGADPSAPVALVPGVCGTFYVQWNSPTASTISRFSTSGTEAAADPAYTVGGRGGRALAVPVCTTNGHTQDCPLLAADKSGPDISVRDCLHGTFDFSPGSSLGMIINGGGSRAFLAERFAPGGAMQPALAVAPIRDSTCAYLYDEQSLYTNPSDVNNDGYSKGRVVPLAGVASGFTVGAAARLGSDGMVIAGIGGATGPAWAVSLDASLAPIHQGGFTVGGTLSAVVTSVTVDSGGNVFVCGTSRSRSLFPRPGSGLHPQAIPVTTEGWVAQGTPDLASWAILTMPLTVDGCALAPSGKLVVSGTYGGTYQGQTSQGTDIFLALVTPGTGGAAPTLASFVRHGTNQNEPMVSAPSLDFGSVYLAGVTQGDWGAAVGVGQNKVFLARFDPTTLALF